MMGVFQDLARATRDECAFKYSPIAPFERVPFREGWIKIARALTWYIEDLAAQGRTMEAARWTIVATTFGLDLCGGTMSDATLGYEIANDARAVIAGSLTSLSASELNELGTGIARALDRMPRAETTIANESVQMLTAIKLIQSSHQNGTLDALAKSFYGRSRAAIASLSKFDDQKRSVFFRSLLNEQVRVVERLVDDASQPGAMRGELVSSLSGEGKVLAEDFFYGGDSWLRLRDKSLARTRLLALTAFVIATAQSSGKAPESLDEIRTGLDLDPYTNKKMGYIPLGRDFIMYSFGEDGKDDRGDSDSKRLSPDIRLEDAPL